MSKYIPKISYKQNMRDQVVEEFLCPVAKELFDKFPEVKCCILGVGQYYNDEASNAVHAKVFPSLEEYSTWDNLFTQSLYKDDYWIYSNPIISFLNLSIRRPELENNGTMISAFQEYCVPSYQDDSLKQRYRPYACASRAGVKVIGEVASKESGKLVDYDFLFQKLSTEIFATDRIHMYGFDGFKHKNAEAVVNSIINEIIFDILGL